MEKIITRLTLTTEDEDNFNTRTAELETELPLDVIELMELVETLISGIPGYSKHELESYILDWAYDIKASREN